MCLIVEGKKSKKHEETWSYQKRNSFVYLFFFCSMWIKWSRAHTKICSNAAWVLCSCSLPLCVCVSESIFLILPLQIVWIYCRHFTRFVRLFSDSKVLGILFVPSRVLAQCIPLLFWMGFSLPCHLLLLLLLLLFLFMCKMQLWLNFNLIRSALWLPFVSTININAGKVNYGKWGMCRCSFVSFVWSFIILDILCG